MTTSNLYTYQPDILGEDYQQLTLNFADDYDGKVVATLVRKKAAQTTKKKQFYTFMVLQIISSKKKWQNNLTSMVMTFMHST